MMTVDPAHYKESVTKLFGSVRPRPISKLSWSIDEDRPLRPRSAADDLADSISEDESVDSQTEGVNDAVEDNIERKDAEEANEANSLEPEQEGFSLSKLLGLAPITAVEPISCVKQNISEEEQEQCVERMPSFDITKLDLETLLFDPCDFEKIPMEDYAFCRRCGLEEFIMLWKGSRPFLREQFKKQIKEANRKYKPKPVRK